MTRIVVMGGGPAGYEAALVAAQHGADVTVVERDGMGGACVLDDCVPSKTFIASAGVRSPRNCKHNFPCRPLISFSNACNRRARIRASPHTAMQRWTSSTSAFMTFVHDVNDRRSCRYPLRAFAMFVFCVSIE